MILPQVYGHVGVNVGCTLPRFTSVGSYTLVYHTEREECICSSCASLWVNKDNVIAYVGTYDEGPDLICEECGEEIKSSYGE